VPDLGADRIVVYELDPANADLERSGTDPITVAPGAGPRHLAFHPNGRYAYLINELDSTVVAYERDTAAGTLDEIAVGGTLPSAYEGENYTAEIQVHPSGKYSYGSNRGHDSIAVFELDDSGRPTYVECEPSGGEWPRNFAIEPSGSYLYCANMDTNSITRFEISNDGRLQRTADVTAVTAPSCVRFL